MAKTTRNFGDVIRAELEADPHLKEMVEIYHECAEEQQEAWNLLMQIKLRAGYIIGQCRGEEEMKGEAKRIIELISAYEEDQ
jgi:hypothetical protein